MHIYKIRHITIGLLFSTLMMACGSSGTMRPRGALGKGSPQVASLPQGTSWVDSLMNLMTLEEKVGQLISAKAFGSYLSNTSDEYDRLVRLVEQQKVGGLVMFQGDVYATAVLLNTLQQKAKIPLLISADFERGVAMRLRRGTYFPDAMALGATRSFDYAYRVGRSIAEEARAIGIHQNFAPVADINNNPENPVINTRSFGEDRQLVAGMSAAYARGLNDGRMISTAKHFPGHGDTGIDSHLDLPVLPFGRSRLDSVELVSFRRAIDDGVMSIMVAHLEVPAIDTAAGRPATLSPPAITGLLKNELGFQGLIVTDALDMQGLSRGYSVGQSAIMAFQAGNDMLLLPSDEQIAINALVGAIRRGTISEERLDASVRKILTLKEWLGLKTNPLVDLNAIADRVATKENWLLSKEIARAAVTVVRNQNNLLPLQPYGKKKPVAVIVSDTEDNRTEINRPGNPWPNEPFGTYFLTQVRKRYGNIEVYRLTPASNRIDFDTALALMKRADLVLMPLYVKVRSSSGKIGIPQNMTAFVDSVAALRKPVVVLSYGNPYLVGVFPNAQALLCAYTDAEVLVDASVEAIFGEIQVRGKLPVSIPGKFNFGTGVEYAQVYLRREDPTRAGFDLAKLQRVENIVSNAIRDSVFPAGQLIILKDNDVVYNKAFGTYTYDSRSREIDSGTMFDLASLTKVVSTTSAAMKLFDQGKVALEDPVRRYIPQFSAGPKRAITIRHLLTHTSGLKPFLKLYDVCKTPEQALDTIYASTLIAAPGDSMIYSDLGMITLAKIVEKITGMPLDAFVWQEFFEPLGTTSTMFNPPESLWTRVAPTEIDTVWRMRLVQGTVHDERAALLGGVAGHAGLFSTASDLAVFMQMLMNKGSYGGVRYLNESTVKEFTQRKDAQASRGLGWDLKSVAGSSAGDLFSMSSFGHTGFTGTSIWADPERNLVVIFLSNRVYPTRANNKIRAFRPVLHDAVIQSLVGQSSKVQLDAKRREK